MPKYKVKFYYEEAGSTMIEAKDKEQAQELIYDKLVEDGIDFDFNIKSREFGITEVEKLPNDAEPAIKAE
jgi:hypothetical protein